MAAAPPVDVLSELLIAQLLAADINSNLEFENLQFQVALADSAGYPSGNGKDKEIQVEDVVHLNSDAAFAQALQHSEESGIASSRMFAQKLAAEEKKALLDMEFAKALQEKYDNDPDGAGSDTAKGQTLDADSLLGKDAVESILSNDPNDKGKGKAVQKSNSLNSKITIANKKDDILLSDKSSPTPYPICTICMDPFQLTFSPIAASKSANSSAKLPFGLSLPCPNSHSYCLDCISHYIKSKLDPEGDGTGNNNAVVFPIKCPECDLQQWGEGIGDDVAKRVLDEKEITLWYHQKLLDSMPKFYCPNPRCSALVQIDEDEDDTQAVCPACSTMICIPCRVVWHANLNCEEFQALPLDERSPEDQQALQLMKAKNWRRCPKCAVIVELTIGCNHIQCRCGAHFCFRCGALWDTKLYCCTRKPSCQLWDEAMLFEERERGREAAADRGRPGAIIQNRQPRLLLPVQELPPLHAPLVAQHYPNPPLAPPIRPYVPPPAPLPAPRIQYNWPQDHAHDEFDWMNDPNILCMRHFFTTQMMQTLTCLYCHAKATSIADLQYHLTHLVIIYTPPVEKLRDGNEPDAHCMRTHSLVHT
ncbi:hypothetical protein ABKN59_009402 [Abortiporus biennis]